METTEHEVYRHRQRRAERDKECVQGILEADIECQLVKLLTLVQLHRTVKLSLSLSDHGNIYGFRIATDR